MDIQPEKTTAQYHTLPGYATSPSIPHGEGQPLSSTLHIENEGKSHSNSIIYDSDHQTRLYTTTVARSKSFGSKPDTTIYRGSDNSIVATLYFYKFSGQPLATFTPENALSLRQGMLELGTGIDGPLMDEIIVCAVALAELARRTRDVSVTAGFTTS